MNAEENKVLFYRFKKAVAHLVDFILFFIKFNRIKRLCMQSLLWPSDNRVNLNGICPICYDGKVKMLIKLPLGYPIRQNHVVLYYDYTSLNIDTILKFRNILDRTAGFFLGVMWNFCPRCKNASLSIDFSNGHLKTYFSSYFVRLAESGERRKNVKELHGKYIDTFLKRNSDILDIGAAEGYAASYLIKKGHSVWAYEPSCQFRENLMRKKYLYFVDEINNLKTDSFDCIYLHHVFEHIPHPAEYLSRLSNLLKPSGLLFIQVPDLSLQLPLYPLSLKRSIYSKFNPYIFNFDSNYFDISSTSRTYHWLDALNNDHLSAFTPEGLSYILKKSNFSVEVVCQTTADRLQFDGRKFAWPVDSENGNTPNGLTVISKKQ